MHPNYLLDSQNAAAPGARAALPRAALARNVLRAGGRDARRQVLRAAGLLDRPARLGQQEQLHMRRAVKSREPALRTTVRDLHRGKCVYPVPYRPKQSTYILSTVT